MGEITLPSRIIRKGARPVFQNLVEKKQSDKGGKSFDNWTAQRQLTFHIKVGELQESTDQEVLKLEEIGVTNPQFKMKCPGKFRRVAERDKETSTPSN